MELIIEGGLLEKELVQPLLNEANEIVAIMAASWISASGFAYNRKSHKELERAKDRK
jgi:hypothetical protein